MPNFQKLRFLEKRIGQTPCIKLEHDTVDLFAKLEYTNFMGSIKDRTAYNILKQAIDRGEIGEQTTVIESSSGNFAVSCAAMCHCLGLDFIAVIDPGINQAYEQLIRYFAADVIRVTKKDRNHGYVLSKIEAVKDYCQRHPNTFWTNQYANNDNFLAHYEGTGEEIANQTQSLDYAFIAVASGGTIAGTSCKLKERFPKIKIVAVDAVGSVIFGRKSSRRYIPGMGSGMVPPMVERAQIDEVIWIDEPDTLAGCRELFCDHGLFLGGSSGTAYAAVNAYFKGKSLPTRPRVVFLCADRGLGYAGNIYNQPWLAEFDQKRDREGLTYCPPEIASHELVR